MVVAGGEHQIPLLQPSYSASTIIQGEPFIKRNGNVWTAVAHIITGVIGSGVLSLSWGVAQLGWIAGPLVILFFASITMVSSYLLSNCYRSPDPEYGPLRNPSYLEAIDASLGKKNARLCGIFVQLGFFGAGIAYTITSGISIRTIQESDCKHKEGHDAACAFGDISYMLLFGAIQLLLSQIPDFHNIQWLSIIAAVMSFGYSLIGMGLGVTKVIGDGQIHGSITGISTNTTAEKVWLIFQGIGDIAFAFPFCLILLEIQDTLKAPPTENQTMKKASTIGVIVTTFFYLCCGGFGYAAFGDATPGNLLTGFGSFEPYWLVDIANACIVFHLVGGYQVYSQPLFANVERWFAEKFPNSGIVKNEYCVKLPMLPPFRLNLLRLCFRSAYVVATTTIAITFPYFNQVLGVLGGLNFWPLSIYFPVEMYFKQRNIQAWSKKWIALRTFSILTWIVTTLALIGSIEGIIREKLR